MKYVCRTLFDCSPTGITGHFRIGQIPFQDHVGQSITDIHSWNRSRNQQRNFETLLQIISLRSQPERIKLPFCDQGTWSFSFEVEAESTFSMDGNPDPFAALYQDCNGVPMLTGLDERNDVTPVLEPKENIWFETVNS
jgi:hypothetical protein